MANAIYPKAKEAFLRGQLNLETGTVKVALVDTAGYTYSPAHEFLSDLGVAVISTPQTLASKTFTNGIFDATDVIFPTVTPVGTTIEALVLLVDTGTPTTSRLIAYQDTGVTGLPVLANGGSIEVVWDNGDDRILRL